jgi:hypothetical protein
MHRDPLQFLQTALAGRYRIERLLGTGGTAAVYLAQDPRHDRQVAIKVLRPEVALALGADRFLREIRIAARLNHPHILPLHDSGEADGLLYYVMPYVAGESVRERLVRQRQVPVEDAVQIARQVASALSHAHAHGIVHRDIKPENILLQDGMALVADFGLARALTEAKEGQITETGVVMGTPAYMSPEQASGSPAVDGRTDIYALGCVLYEMLSGSPPFPGENAAAVLARHISDPVPPLRTPQQIPGDVVEAVRTALAKRPEDRFQHASHFLRALEGQGYGRRRRRTRLARGATAAVVLALAVVGLVRAVPDVGTWLLARFGPELDPGLYLVLPAAAAPDSLQVAAVAGVRAGLTRWRDIRLADPAELTRPAAFVPPRETGVAEARRKAIRLGAAWLALVDAQREADSLLVATRLVDTRSGHEISRAGTTLGLGTGFRPGLADLANHILLDIPDRRHVAPALLGTTRLKAARQFAAAEQRAGEWDLAMADSALASALREDPAFTLAALQLAKLRAWQGRPPATWKMLLDQVSAGRSALDERDAALHAGLDGIASARHGQACGDLLAAAHAPAAGGDFDLWYTAGVCLEGDRAVVRDPRSPSGWRFRSSPNQAILAFDHAFTLNPAFSAERQSPFRKLLIAEPDVMRGGRALAPAVGDFGAFPALQGDTLAFVPWPIAVIESAAPVVPVQPRLAALHRARERLAELAAAWVAERPRDPAALEALGIAMELRNDPAACDTLRRARALTTAPGDGARIAALEAFIRVKEGLRGEPEGWAKARGIADTVLRSLGPDSVVRVPAAVAGLAALVGRGGLAAQLERWAAEQEFSSLPAAVRDPGSAFLVYAAMGGPADSIRRYGRRVREAMATLLVPTPEEAGRAEEELERNFLRRTAGMLYPGYGADTVLRASSSFDYLVGVLRRMARGDTAAAIRQLAAVVEERWGDGIRYANLDGVLPEVRILAQAGQPAQAAAWLDSAFVGMANAPATSFADPVQVGSLVRAMVLRAELARQLGDPAGAQRWARAVTALWDGADAGFADVVSQMQSLARQ